MLTFWTGRAKDALREKEETRLAIRIYFWLSPSASPTEMMSLSAPHRHHLNNKISWAAINTVYQRSQDADSLFVRRSLFRRALRRRLDSRAHHPDPPLPVPGEQCDYCVFPGAETVFWFLFFPVIAMQTNMAYLAITTKNVKTTTI